ncbi:MAG: DUF4848 domain-containing protein [Staphylococcus sp.]|nr:DUF4848 domain-containing protein [Staphylococcus sp.]
MKTSIKFLSVLTISAAMFSCSNDEPAKVSDASTKGVEIVSLSDYLPQISRSGEPSEKVLKFSDKAAYDNMISQLKNMDADSRIEYLTDLGFESAYVKWKQADAELEAIFDDESLDSCAFGKEVASFVEKYEDTYNFYQEDETDVTPRLKFEDKDMALVATSDGHVVIGDELVTASLLAAVPTGPMDTSIVKTCEASVKNDKYTSFLSVGRIGDTFAFKTQTYRKKNFGTKYAEDVIHIGDLLIADAAGHVISTHIETGRGTWKLYGTVSSFNMYLDIIIADFHSSKRPDNKVTKEFKNIVMK